MTEAWRIARSSRVCARSGETIPPGEPFYSALIDKGESFERLNFTAKAWPEVDKGEFFSYWKNKGSEARGERQPPLDYERLLAFFDSLENAREPAKILFRYVLALMLARRRRLRLDDMSRSDSGDRLLIYDRRTERTLEIIAPPVEREDLERTQEKLNQLFDCDLGDGDL